MIDVYIVYNDPMFPEKIKSISVNNTPYLHFLDEQSKWDKKEAFQLKSEWGAKLSPFVIIYEEDIPKKAFYSEADDVLECLTNYLKEYDNRCISNL